MKDNKVKKINIIDENELKDVAGGFAFNEEWWECPRCGYVIILTHDNDYSKVQEHLETHVDHGEVYNR